MKYVQYLALSATMAFAFSLTALAKDANSGNFTVDDTVQVGSAQLAPGNYKAQWSGPANDLHIDILHNGKTVATTTGRIKDLQQPAPYSAVLVKPSANNQRELGEIDFDHRSEALVFGGE
jgi:hypothetical protein